MKINRLVSNIILIVLTVAHSLLGYAEQSPLNQVLQKGRAVVSIEAVDAAVYKEGKPQAARDPKTGRILIIQRMRRVASVQTGGGIILSPDGIIVTAAHTLKNKRDIIVTLFDGTRLPAKIVHQVKGQDTAFLTVSPPFALDTVQFANSDAVPIGMPVYAMGRAQWIKGTLTGGRISAFGLDKMDGVTRVTSLRIDFKAYKGDSGSPILDGNGNLLGMISAGQVIGSETFAITSNLIGTAYNDYLQSR